MVDFGISYSLSVTSQPTVPYVLSARVGSPAIRYRMRRIVGATKLAFKLLLLREELMATGTIRPANRRFEDFFFSGMAVVILASG